MSNERGRPRSFDTEAALDCALEVFWKNGFQGASLAELTSAMGLSKPSLYAAFGDKEALYLKALDRYASRWIARHAAILESEPDGRRAVEGFLRSAAAMVSDPSLPGGCFVITGTADCGGPATPAAVDAALRKTQQSGETLLRERLFRAMREAQLPENARVNDLAAFFNALLAGLGVMAKSGASRDKLNAAIDAAMAAWPTR